MVKGAPPVEQVSPLLGKVGEQTPGGAATGGVGAVGAVGAGTGAGVGEIGAGLQMNCP